MGRWKAHTPVCHTIARWEEAVVFFLFVAFTLILASTIRYGFLLTFDYTLMLYFALAIDFTTIDIGRPTIDTKVHGGNWRITNKRLVYSAFLCN